MKKIFAILSVFAAVIGCQKPEMDQPAETDGVKIPVKITADIAQTKTTMTNENGVLKSAWKDGDKIYVQQCRDETYDNEVVEYMYSVSAESSEFIKNSETNFSGPGSYDHGCIKLYAMYPSNLGNQRVDDKTFSMSNMQTQSAPGDLTHIENSNILVAFPAAVDWSAEEVSVNLSFNHALSVLELDLKASGEGVNISSILVDVTGGDSNDFLVVTSGSLNLQNIAQGTITKTAGVNSMTLELASVVELPVDDYAKFYMTISSGHAGQTFNVKVVTDMGETLEVGSMTVPADSSIPQGAKAIKKFTVQTPEKDEVDYNSAIDLSANGTANTYIVNAANTLYKFKADVKGNGTVPAALSGEGVGATTTIAPKTALLLWYNCLQTSKEWVDQNPVEVSSIELKDGYIYFRTPETFVNGNAVIAAFAEEDLTYTNITVDENRLLDNATILWSWNIWASEGYDIEADAFKAGDFTIMGRNIGAVVGKTEIETYQTASERKYVAASAIGNYYQWGNKNPYPHVSDYESYEIPKYGNLMYCTPTYTPILALKDSMNGNVAMSGQMFGTLGNFTLDLGTYLSEEDRIPAKIVAMTESAPYKYMQNSTSSYSYSWTGNIGGTCLINLWGDATLEDVSDHVKTIYDPCPAGWKVWEDDAWDAMVAAGAKTAVIDMNALDDAKGGFGSIVCGSYFASNGGGRNTVFAANRLTRCGYPVETAYAVSNPSLYAYGYFGQKYLVTHAASFTANTNIELKVSTFLCTGYSTPLRCIKE